VCGDRAITQFDETREEHEGCYGDDEDIDGDEPEDAA